MGEMADLLNDGGYGPPDWCDFDGPMTPEDYFNLSDVELKQATALARSDKIKGIRKWPNPLSERQRWCLANWIAENDNKYSFAD